MGVIRSMSALLERATSYPTVSYAESPIVTDPINRQILSTNFFPPLSPQDILTPEEVAARLKVPPSWVYEKTRARCRNPMPCLRLGRYIRFAWPKIIEWLSTESQQQAAPRSVPAKRPTVRPAHRPPSS